MLAGQCDAALPLWRRLQPSSIPAFAAALVICETVAGENQFSPVWDNEIAVSQEFVTWYQKLLQFSARPTMEGLNGRIEKLEKVLPTAACILSGALAEVTETAPAETVLC